MHSQRMSARLWNCWMPALALWGLTLCPADSVASDPVDDLLQALRTPVDDPSPNSTDLKKRQADLDKRIQALRGVADPCRALALSDWLDEGMELAVAQIDQQARGEVVKRLVDKLRVLLGEDDPTTQLAAATLIGEWGVQLRETV